MGNWHLTALGLICVSLALCVGGCKKNGGAKASAVAVLTAEDAIEAGSELMQAGKNAEAVKILKAAAADSDSQPLLILTGFALERVGDVKQAVEYFERVTARGGEEAVFAHNRAGEALLKDRQILAAERQFQRALEIDEFDVVTIRNLAWLLTSQARRWESAKYFELLVRLGDANLEELAMLANLKAVRHDANRVTKYLTEKRDEKDASALVSGVQVALYDERFDEAENLLEEVEKNCPDLLIGKLLRGQLLIATDRYNEIENWNSQLSNLADEHPQTWKIRGQFFRESSDVDAATRCYWEAVRLDPNDQDATYALSQLLAVNPDHAVIAGKLAERTKQLDQLRLDLIKLQSDPSAARMAMVAQSFEALGRHLEAEAWWRVGRNIFELRETAEKNQRRLSADMNAQTPRTLTTHQPALALDVTAYPQPKFATTSAASATGGGPAKTGPAKTGPAKTGPAKTGPSITETTRFAFSDDAKSVGVNFSYVNGDDPDALGMHIYQSNGGGVAVLDFDGDHWPDLYFTQSGSNAPLEKQEPSDRLFRNQGGRFDDVTESVGLLEANFSQGVTVGDFNNDGFDDLYVANIGHNRLLRNNGDGTFTDVTEAAGITGPAEWTTSCAMVDLTGDGVVDLIDVNYLSQTEPYTRVCTHPNDGKNRVCQPSDFEAAGDVIWRGAGDGTFVNETEKLGFTAKDGRGLGVIVAQLDDQPGLEVFVANDMSANFLYQAKVVRESTSDEFRVRWIENASLTGFGYDGKGRAQACMGMAVSDIDQNGLLDLYVTNFHNDINTLYYQPVVGLFQDVTLHKATQVDSRSHLGFGTQAIDIDSDSWPDLVVTNGHVDDYSEFGTPFLMPPQCIRNVHGRLVEEFLPDYFNETMLGRSLATLDWNRDGRLDFTVSHLRRPAALLTNETQSKNHFLQVELIGTRSARTAFGTRLIAKTSTGQTATYQLTAGNGFQAANQRLLHLGLGEAETVAELTVIWPSGLIQQFSNIAADQEWQVVEGEELRKR
jgi:tetratricopeptide (TPR) repeat protein